jgi:hypothetical protein
MEFVHLPTGVLGSKLPVPALERRPTNKTEHDQLSGGVALASEPRCLGSNGRGLSSLGFVLDARMPPAKFGEISGFLEDKPVEVTE